jgi:DNA invertase Pin-like site-specific DNA recombinase
MNIGYIRVSTLEQNHDLQEDALNEYKCEKYFYDKASGKNAERKGLSDLKEFARKGDAVIVWRLDRLGRSLKDLIEWMNYFEANDISFISIKENINTSTSTGKLIFHIFGALSEFERNLIIERTKAGLVAARSRGRIGGRPKKLSDVKIKLLIHLYNKKEHSIDELCDLLGISKPTLYSYIKKYNS